MVTLTSSFALLELTHTPGWVSWMIAFSILVFLIGVGGFVTKRSESLGFAGAVVMMLAGMCGLLYGEGVLYEGKNQNQSALAEVVVEMEDALKVEFLGDSALGALGELAGDMEEEFVIVEGLAFLFEGGQYRADVEFRATSLSEGRIVSLFQVDTSEEFNPLVVADAVSDGK